jgi:hypothetical protein
MSYFGLERLEVKEATAGDIVAISGHPHVPAKVNGKSCIVQYPFSHNSPLQMRRYFTETIIDWRIFDAFLGKHLFQTAVTTPPDGHFQ